MGYTTCQPGTRLTQPACLRSVAYVRMQQLEAVEMLSIALILIGEISLQANRR